MRKLMLVMVLSALGCVGPAFAGTYTLNPDPATIGAGGTANVQVLFAGDGDTQDTQLDLAYDATSFPAVTSTVLVPGSVCAVLTGPARVRIIPPSGAGSPLTATATAYCGFAMQSAAAIPLGNYDLTQSFIECTGTATPACVRAGTFRISVVGSVAPPTLSYAPAFDADGVTDATAEVSFSAGALNTVATFSITPTATGGTATASTAIACTAAPAAFAITGGGTQTFNAPGTGAGTPIGLSVTRGTLVQTGTLTCVETDSPGGAMRTRLWDLFVPAAELVPEVDTVPPSGGTASVSGLQGSSASGAITVRNVGTGPLAVTGCAITGAGFTLGAVTNPVAAGGGTGSIAFSCAVPQVPGQTITGTLTCNTDDVDEGTITYNLSCLAISTSIPTMGLGAKALLTMMMLSLGLAALQMYRRSA